MEHFVALRRGNHPNKDMQRDWNKNSRGFRFDVIEFCPIKDLNVREHYGIEELNTVETGYNQGWVPYKRKEKKQRRTIKRYRKTR